MVIIAKLTIPCAYQGGKQRIAKQVVDIILQYINNDNNNSGNIKFYDMCCGSGAISIELVNQSFNPDNIIMVDASPWGLFWRQIGDGTFSMYIFKYWIDSVPKDISKIQEYIKELSKNLIHKTQLDISYIFLLLQASSFGSKSIWIKNNKWRNTSFRNYWLPTETSSRRSPVNPMMPMPNTLYQRVQELSFGMEGVKGYYGDCNDMHIENNSIIYIDPPYDKTTKYGFEFDYMKFIEKYKNNNIILLSEGIVLSDNNYNLTDRRSKGGISGERKKKANEEWLNVFGRVS